MKHPESALDALKRKERQAYARLSDYGKAMRDERQRNAQSAKHFYGDRAIGLKRPKVKKAIK